MGEGGGKSQKRGNICRRLLWTDLENKNTGQAYVFFAQFCELAAAATFTIILNRSTNKKE
jgi:hypothetical protein